MTFDFARIDRRETRYRFDLDLDVPWQSAGAAGLYYPERLLTQLGLSTSELTPAMQHTLQVCLALATCDAFARLEEDVIAFVSAERTRIPESKSLALLVEEEHKHALLFRRYARELRAREPEAALMFDRLYRPPVTFCEAFAGGFAQGDARDFQYFFWRNTVFFEEYTIYLYELLARDAALVQPCWLQVHTCHMREEVQHLVTDVAYLTALALALPEPRRQAIDTLFQLFLREHFDSYSGRTLGLSVIDELLGRPAQAALPFDQLPFAHDFRSHRAFRRTRDARAPEDVREPSVADEKARGGHDRDAGSTGPKKPGTLLEALESAAQREPEACVVFVEGTAEQRLSYRELLVEARMLAEKLSAHGITKGQSVVLTFLKPRELVSFFWACLVRGCVPVPLSPPTSLRALGDDLDRLLKVNAALTEPVWLVDDTLHETLTRALEARGEPLHCLSASLLQKTRGTRVMPHQTRPSDVAFVQFSSGSMGTPRGVALSHANILENARAMLEKRKRKGTGEVFVSFLPLYHDMGLIGFHLTPVVAQSTQVLTTPLAFLRDPLAWLELLSRHRATVTGAPNFALARVLEKLGDLKNRLDLSSLHTVLVGAEPVAFAVLSRFMHELAPQGLAARSMCPGYGLAEATLAVTMLEPDSVPSALSLRRTSLTEASGVRVSEGHGEDSITLTCVGTPLPRLKLRITDGAGSELPDGVAGTIEVSGASVMTGYAGEAHGDSRRNGWLDTGDLGVLHEGQLYVTGRKKDVFFVAGKNYFAHDVEDAVRGVSGVLGDYVALIVDWDDAYGVDSLAVLVASADPAPEQVDALLRRVHDEVRRRFGFSPACVIAAKKRDFLRTTSGKLQRHRLLERYRAGSFAGLPHYRPERSRSAKSPAPVAHEAPASQPMLDLVCRLWREALGTDVTLHSDFRALGGTSIMAAEIHGRLEHALGRALDASLLLSAGTPHTLARALDRLLVHSEKPMTERPDGHPDVNTRTKAPDVPFEPIAIIAAGVRVPGARGLAEFAERLARADSCIAKAPVRWDLTRVLEPGREALPVTGAFLEDVECFDAQAFDLPRDQAERMDPQQRVFLEVALDALSGARTGEARVGVFVGSGDSEYTPVLHRDGDLDRHALVGTLANMSAGRVAQLFGLTGPALTVNSACSSSLVAVHQACRALHAGDCDVALAGGVQVNLTERTHRYFRDAGLLSRSGVARPLDERADGLVPGEGAGAVLLKPLSRALADRDPVLGVIRGSAINNDGGALSGTAPNPEGQKTVLQRAYGAAQVSPLDVGYVEAHAAGTALGDALEMRALDDFFLAHGRSTTCAVGSVKGHLGHTLAAAGILGLLKALCALQAGQIAPTSGCTTPAARIDFARTRLTPVRSTLPFHSGHDGLRRAGVSSFGLGGTNAHLVLEQAPPEGAEVHSGGPFVFCLAAPEGRLGELARADHARLLESSDGELAALCRASAVRLASMPERRALVVESREELLTKLSEQPLSPGVRKPGRVVFVAPGPGAQSVGMGRYLLAREPAFRAAFDACAEIARRYDLDLHAIVRGEPGAPDIHRIDISQPVTFAFSMALAALLRELSIVPDIVLGHSAGEYAAAALSGMLTVEDALALVIARGRAMAAAPPGRMAALFAPASQVEALLRAVPGELAIAANNGPEQTVLSGDREAIEALLSQASTRGITARLLHITCAAHSPRMHGARAELARALAFTKTSEAHTMFISTLSAEPCARVHSAHWLEHLVETVHFDRAIARAFDEGGRLFVELGASGGLSWCIDRILDKRRDEAAAVSLLRGEAASGEEAVHALATLYEAGLTVAFERLGGSSLAGEPQRLPLLPLTRTRHWLEPKKTVEPDLARSDAMVLDAQSSAVRDHITAKVATAPLALLLDRVLARELAHTGLSPALQDAVVMRPLAVTGHGARLLVEVDGERRILRSFVEHTGTLTTHFECRVAKPRGRVFAALDVASIRERCPRTVSAEDIYRQLAEGGFELGPTMRCLAEVHVGDGEVLTELVAPRGADLGVVLSPALVDAAAHSLVALGMAHGVASQGLYLGFSIGELEVHGRVPERCLAYVRLSVAPGPDCDIARFDVVLSDAHGTVLASVRDFSAKRVSTQAPPSVVLSASPSPSPSAPAPTLKEPVSAPPSPRAETVSPDDVESFLRAELARSLRIQPERIHFDMPLSRLGVDSLLAVELLGKLSRKLSLRLTPTLLFEHRTLRAVCTAVRDEQRRQRP